MLGGKNSRFYFTLFYLLISIFLLSCSTSSIDYNKPLSQSSTFETPNECLKKCDEEYNRKISICRLSYSLSILTSKNDVYALQGGAMFLKNCEKEAFEKQVFCYKLCEIKFKLSR
jgi:hypothetical protein